MAALPVLAGCGRDEAMDPHHEDKSVSVRLSADGEEIRSLAALRFDDGILQEVRDGLSAGSGGKLTMDFTEKSGTVFFWANASGILEDEAFAEGSTTLDEFLDCTAVAGMMTEDGVTMTGSAVLDGAGSELPVRMVRSVARLDLDARYEGVSVNKVTVSRVSEYGYVNNVDAAPASSPRADAVKDFGSEGFAGGVAELFHLCGQPEGPYRVEAEVTVNGAWRMLESTLDAIDRNTVYTLTVYGNGSSLGISVSGDGWETGDSQSPGQVKTGYIDLSASELSEGVRVSGGLDTLFLPYGGCSVSLAIASAVPGSSVTVKGSIDGVDIVRDGAASPDHAAVFAVTGGHRYPGRGREYAYLDIASGDTVSGRVVIVAEANPVGLTGKIDLSDGGVCDFGRYVDGELGVMVLPEGMTASLRFPEGENEWMRLTEISGGTFRIEGGWRPNDPEANGRVQSAEIVVTASDGGSEVYTVRRLNWGLPVVNINGTWWCKYNLRGNVKDFGDQITIASDPADASSLAEYLTTCPDEEFAEILGDQYQGGRQDGLKLTAVDGSLLYSGFDASSSGDFGLLDPEYMAPDGYSIPDYQDYRFFTWNENANLGYGPDGFNNLLGQRITYTITPREAVVGGVEYGPVHIYDFVYEGTHWVMAGFGHQYNATDIAPMSLLFATYGTGGKTWMLEGYSKSDGRGNWFKYSAQNAGKTRLIRCVKTPVEYIY